MVVKLDDVSVKDDEKIGYGVFDCFAEAGDSA